MNNNLVSQSFPATFTDKLVSAAFESVADVMIQVEMRFSNRLDPGRLRKALQLVLDAEPILGCRFNPQPRQPRWERLPKNRRDNFQVFDNESQYEKYELSTIDPKTGPAVRAGFLSTPESDMLLLKIAHEAADSGGTKDIAYLIARIYTKLKDDPDYKPEPNINGARDAWQVLGKIPLPAFPRIFANWLVEVKSMIRNPVSHNPPMAPATRDERQYVIRHIHPERVSRIVRYGKQRNAKINDMIMAAWFRALMRTGWDGRSRLRSFMTVDLRNWHIPGGQAGAVCNLSGSEVCELGTDPGKTFEDTLEKVVTFTRNRKKNWIGLNLFAGPGLLMFWRSRRTMAKIFARQMKMFAKKNLMFPIFTNLGPMDDRRLVFDKKPPTSAWIVAPAGMPPFFGTGMSGYRGSLTLSAGTFSTSTDTIENVYDMMLEELPR